MQREETIHSRLFWNIWLFKNETQIQRNGGVYIHTKILELKNI